ncbi:hypothetical protein [Hyphomonas sp.]|jgi:hypothetical protein|uniref:hypothetical protein n=1 Tax=Hyphomonas sp. TaxID=87 RepID=UPI0025C1D9FF|nr:hypothetical protein [Hyphomonas sp.]|tara:strand:- start:867 stop:1019 length:153 start_codon:yes stop_codon:yes gene_type:complete
MKINNHDINYLKKTLQFYLDMLNTYGFINSYSFEEDTKDLIKLLKKLEPK